MCSLDHYGDLNLIHKVMYDKPVEVGSPVLAANATDYNLIK